MALIGLSLVLASVVYIAIRRPPFLETLLALWRGHSRIEKPPTTRSLPPSDTGADQDQSHTNNATSRDETKTSAPSLSSSTKSAAETDRAAMPPPPPPILQRPDGDAAPTITTTQPPTTSEPSPQTTPKASATQLNGGIPSFSLSASPPASAAAVARNTDSVPSSALPSLSGASPPSLSTHAAPATSMAPPPRPPTLNSTNNSSLLAAPAARPSPLPNRGQPPAPAPAQHDRQPGTSTLAPPPTHSSKPVKPSRKVTLSPGHSPLDWARLASQPASDLRGLGPGAPYLRVTPSMLRRQTGRRGKDAWTALGGRVYNMTPYLPFHPGGEPELLRAAGRDGTRLFGEIHPWVNYETMLASCLVGLLVEEGEAESSGEMDAMD